MGKRVRGNATVVYHTRVPMNRINRFVFIPDEALKNLSEREVKETIGGAVQKCTADLLAIDVQPYLQVTERRVKQTQADGVERFGTRYDVIIMIGKPALVKMQDGTDITDVDDKKKLITVSNN